MKLPKHMGVVVKVTHDCNMNCVYCYMDKEREKTGSKIMDFNTLENLVKKFTRLKSATFIWHGGEPLLPGIGFYKKAIEFEKKYSAESGCKIKNIIQTNATLLNDRILSFFKKEKIHVGVSLDGPAEINDKVRLFCSGKGATCEIEKGLEKIKQYESPGMVCVVSKQNANAAAQVYDNLKEKQIKAVRLQPYRGDDSELILDNKSFYQFHRTFYDHWITDPDPLKKIRPLSDVIKILLGGPSLAKEHCFRSNVVVDVNGDVYSCAIIGEEQFKFGNIVSNTLDESLFSEKRISLLNAQKELEEKCAGRCDYYALCKGGCMTENDPSGLDMFSRSCFCGGKKKLYTYIENDLKERLMPLVEQQQIQTG